MKKNKIAAIIMAAAMVCSLTACNEKNQRSENKTQNTVSTSADVNVSVEETKAPEESNTPEESKIPEESSTPEESRAPEESTAPENGGSVGAIDNETTGTEGSSGSKKDTVQFSASPVALTGEAGKGDAIARLARAQTGVMFKLCAASPEEGFDNSGLMYYVLNANGISCPRMTDAISQMGSKIKYDELKVGDLVFFQYEEDGTAHYGGVYLGEGKMAISMSDDIPVKIVDITAKYYRDNFMWGICVAR